jgi:hypothetical protein
VRFSNGKLKIDNCRIVRPHPQPLSEYVEGGKTEDSLVSGHFLFGLFSLFPL